MPIDTEHEDRAAWSSRWRRCRDAVSGQHAVHQAGELYLPALKEQDAIRVSGLQRAGHMVRRNWPHSARAVRDGLPPCAHA
jgi:hypothetical protein